MSKLIELTQLLLQEKNKFLFFTLKPKPTRLRKITVEASKIISFTTFTPKEDSISFRSDYPSFTGIELVGRNSIDVTEEPELIKRLIENK